ncbi:MFS transporter [Methanooceanicella nereidis]|uniref:MFS transporter n=1 Tax=Methanooceanicella nereidis TaxID=2052831 RepID=UPI001E2C2A28|nr:MFS transporter [Methanocella sp. CWC-04]
MRTFIISLYAGVYGVVFNLYILDLGFREDFLGLLLSVTLLASSLTSIPAGILCDRVGRRRSMVVSSFLSAATVFPIFLTDSPVLLLLFCGIGGVFNSVSAVCVAPFLIENNVGKNSVRVFSANSALSWTASVAGCAISGVLSGIWVHIPALANMGSHRLTLLAAAFLLIPGCILLLFMKDRSELKPVNKLTFRGFKLSPNVKKFTAISMLIGTGSGMIVPYFNVYFTKVLNAGVFEIGIVFAAADILMVMGFMAIPWLVKKIGKVRSSVITEMSSVPFLIMMAATNNFMIASTSYVARMFLMNVAGPATTSFQMEQLKAEERGLAVGVMSTGNSLALCVSTYAGGLLMAGGNYILPYWITCAAYILAACLMYHYFRNAEKAAPVMHDNLSQPSAAI